AGGGSHAVSNVAGAKPGNLIEYRAQLRGFLRNGAVLEAPLGIPISREGDPQGRDAARRQRVSQGDQKGAILVAGDAVTDDDERRGRGRSGVKGEVEPFAEMISKFFHERRIHGTECTNVHSEFTPLRFSHRIS